MISFPRVLTIVKKDMAWVAGNLKLMGIMILPVFLMIFFSRVDSASTFVFSLIFVNAFVGIFSTSYLIIEEKNKGTLLALLTSPLTGAELLLGKFLFNVLLCGLFSLLVILLNNRIDLLSNPLALANILLFAGTACFFGFVTGVFFKNEQEMSIFAPFLMLLFCLGDAVHKASDKSNLHAFFPDYHVSVSVQDVPFEMAQVLPAFGYSCLLFALAFFMASFYTQFYFSNNREKRFSWRLIGFCLAFVGVLVASGVSAQKTTKELNEQGLDNYTISARNTSASFYFDPEKLNRKTLLQSRSKTMELLTFKDEKDSNIVFAIRDLESDEKDLAARMKKVREDEVRSILSHSTVVHNEQIYQQWNYIKGASYVVLQEFICGEQIFQHSLDLGLKKIERLPRDLKVYRQTFQSVLLECGSVASSTDTK